MSYRGTKIDGDVSVGHDVAVGGKVEVSGHVVVGRDLKVYGWLDAPNIKGPSKGLFKTEAQLLASYPKPRNGWWALVVTPKSSDHLGQLYVADGGHWVAQVDGQGEPILKGTPILGSGEILQELLKINEVVEEIKKGTTDAKALANALAGSKGKANGIAPLDENSRIPISFLPSFVDDVLEFAGVVENVSAQEESSALKSTDANCAVVYNKTTNTFALRLTGLQTKYYNNWGDGDLYGDNTENGRRPQGGKIYIDTTSNKSFRWDGTKLVAIGSALELGHTETTAFPGNEGVKLQTQIGEVRNSLTARFNGVVDDAEVSEISVENVSGVYYIASKKIFVGKSGNKYVNNWTGADMYLNNDRTAIRKDKVYLLGSDAYAWNKDTDALENITATLQKSLSEEAKTRKKEFDGLNSLTVRGLTARFNGILDDAEISHISASNVDGVYYISSKKIFVGKSGALYVNNWDGADMFMSEDRSAIRKDKVYLLGASAFVWNDAEQKLEDVSEKVNALIAAQGREIQTLQKSITEETKNRKADYEHLDDKVNDLDKDLNQSLDALSTAIMGSITANFKGFVDNVNIISSTTTTIKGVYYDRIRKTFVAKTDTGEYITGGSHDGANWMDSYFNSDGSEILKDKIYKCKDKLYCWDDAANNLVQMGNDDCGLKIVMHNADERTFVLTPNALHVWPEMEQLSLTFAAAEDGYVGEYAFQFTCPEDKATTIELPAGIKWYGGRVVVPEAGKVYQASVVNNVIIMGGSE